MQSVLKSFARKCHSPVIKQKVFAYIEENVVLPKFPYNYNEFEPILSEEILRLHHGRHHKAYVDNYLEAMKLYDSEHSIHVFEKLLRKVNFNGGGHINHCIQWNSIVPPSKAHLPTQELAEAIDRDLGGYPKMVANIKTMVSEHQGSGWIWLGYDMTSNTVCLATTDNQEVLQMKTGLIPLIGIDLWEHSYYLQYKNERARYLENILKIINWNYGLSVLLEKKRLAQEIHDETY